MRASPRPATAASRPPARAPPRKPAPRPAARPAPRRSNGGGGAEDGGKKKKTGAGRFYLNLTGFPFPLGPFLERETVVTEVRARDAWE